MPSVSETVAARPRVEGDRELEILHACLRVLADVGYDRLTMDAVAQRARASKATLYRRWSTKVSLVVDALRTGEPPTLPDTGSLREDLRQLFCGLGGLAEPEQVRIFGSVVTAFTHDPEFAEVYRREVIGEKIALSRQVWERARRRGELRADLDLSLIEPALPGIVLHRVLVLGESPDADLITRVIDQIILPAATAASPTSSPTGSPHSHKELP